jgi:large subunit ribosomal protein L18e
MVASKKTIKVRTRSKSNPIIKETVKLALKQKAWIKMAQFISAGKRNYPSINLGELDKKTTAGDTVLVLGKILSSGNLTKKIKIVALAISKGAREKLKETKSEFVHVRDEVTKNPKGEGIKVIN